MLKVFRNLNNIKCFEKYQHCKNIYNVKCFQRGEKFSTRLNGVEKSTTLKVFEIATM